MIDPHDVLHCPMVPNENDARASTVGEFLGCLLSALWEENEGFSGKRPLGNSDWQWQVYVAMAKGGFVAGTFDDDGYLEDFPYDQEQKADVLIQQAIKLAYDHG